jgi:hypothetical protein
VTVPGDPNADNKRAQSNFGNVQVKGGGFADLSIVRRNIEDLPQAIELTVIPRLTKDFQIAQRDIDQNGPLLLNPGETSVDTLRILNRPVKDVRREQPKEDKTARKGNCCCCPPMARRKPDVRGHYPTNPAALPPGVAGKPLVTLVHTVNGRALGGVTFMISHPSKTKK